MSGWPFVSNFVSFRIHLLLTAIFLECLCVFLFVVFAVIIDYFLGFFFSSVSPQELFCLCFLFFSTVTIVGFSHVYVLYVCVCGSVFLYSCFCMFLFLYYKLLISLWFVTYTLTIFFSCVFFLFSLLSIFFYLLL